MRILIKVSNTTKERSREKEECMNTIPMKARKSNSSWVGQPHTGLSPSMRHMQRATKGERRRFNFSIGLFIFTIAGLIIGSSGSVLQDVSAREGYGWGQSRNRGNERSNQPVNRTTNQQPTQPQQNHSQNRTAPSVPARTSPTNQAPAAPTPAQAPAQPQQTAPVRTTPARTATVAPQTATAVEAAPESPPVNTAPEITAMSAAKAVTPAEPVTYTSNQISTETRNRLLALAVSATTSALLIYAMSMFKPNESGAPIRYRIPVREISTR